jgi:3-hydroxyacyl-CoA dehydrogenase
VLVGVCYGFVGNRMLRQRQDEGHAMVIGGAAPWDVDKALVDFGFAMGPFAMSDMAGLDVGWVKAESTGATLRDIMCEQGRLGQKTGAGYYEYDDQRNASPSPVTEQVLADFRAKAGVTPRQIGPEEVLERALYLMINEAAKILEEGVAERASDIDVIWVNGYGWPIYRGGPMYYVDQVGLDKVLARLKHYEAEFGPRFRPAPLLEKLVAEGKTFTQS